MWQEVAVEAFCGAPRLYYSIYVTASLSNYTTLKWGKETLHMELMRRIVVCRYQGMVMRDSWAHAVLLFVLRVVPMGSSKRSQIWMNKFLASNV